MPDVPGNSSTTSFVAVGGWVNGTLETPGDHDWFRVELVAGQKIVISLTGSGGNPLEDPYVYLLDSSGNVIAENDDSGAGRDSRLVFTVPTTGTYYIDVAAWVPDTGPEYTGNYTLSVAPYTPPPVFDYDQIGRQLTHDFWDGDWRAFNVSQGGTITVNLTALTPQGQLLAREALNLWSDVIGVTFVQVTNGGQMTFDDNEEDAYSTSEWSNHVISSSHVNISTDWIASYGATLNSYSFQTYVHEIGHALGLGHGGHYNGDAIYEDDAHYANDAWSTTVMSYFSQDENSYFNAQGFTENFVLTPMAGDIAAMQVLYGLSTTTRTGNTTYGFNSTADRAVFDADANPGAAYTIIDSGGIDTLDYSRFSNTQTINLNPETFSNVGGRVGNVVIARETVVENAIGGMGADLIIGNSADNVLNGGGGLGIDTVSYEAATAGVTVDLGLTTRQDTIGAGRDTLSGFERLTGSAFGDTLTGGAGNTIVRGGAGNDRLIASSDGDTLIGEDGDDRFVGSSANDSMTGGGGFDTVDYSGAAAGVTVSVNGDNQNTGGAGTDSLSSIEEIIGSNHNDVLIGVGTGYVLRGGAGNDNLRGTASGSAQLFGGTGNDIFIVRHSANEVIELAGQGEDVVQSWVSYSLSGNVETLELMGTAAINAVGNSLDNRLVGNTNDNSLNGRAGADVMRGGLGNDRYYVDNSGDQAIENSGEGTDRVYSTVTFALGANVEQLFLSGNGAINAAGNSLDNILVGNGAANSLNGGGGADRMSGGAGDDSYHVDNRDDVVIESAGEGTDTVYSSVNYRLRDNVENMNLTGSAVRAFGNSGDNRLVGNNGNNVLDGLGGADIMRGGAGDDIYYVDNSNDRVIENGGQGTDTIYSSISFALTSDIERLNLTGSTAFRANGNTTANRLVGNDADNILNGGQGADVMRGGMGDDRYYVDNDGDRVIENAGAGVDRVYSTVNFRLGSDVEQLFLRGSAAINGTGNNLDNVVLGNSADNILDGGAGEDRMRGAAGDDTYYVDNRGDEVIENAGQGTDRVYSTVTFTLGANVEQLFLNGNGAIDGTGNGMDNILVGNSAANVLSGGAGDDRLIGGGGGDHMLGGAGSDTFVFRDGEFGGMIPATADRIRDFSQAEGDLIDFSRVDAIASASGDQDFDFIGSAAFSGTAGQLRSEQSGAHTYVYGDTDGDGAADFMVMIEGNHSLAVGDFIL